VFGAAAKALGKKQKLTQSVKQMSTDIKSLSRQLRYGDLDGEVAASAVLGEITGMDWVQNWLRPTSDSEDLDASDLVILYSNKKSEELSVLERQEDGSVSAVQMRQLIPSQFRSTIVKIFILSKADFEAGAAVGHAAALPQQAGFPGQNSRLPWYFEPENLQGGNESDLMHASELHNYKLLASATVGQMRHSGWLQKFSFQQITHFAKCLTVKAQGFDQCTQENFGVTKENWESTTSMKSYCDFPVEEASVTVDPIVPQLAALTGVVSALAQQQAQANLQPMATPPPANSESSLTADETLELMQGDDSFLQYLKTGAAAGNPMIAMAPYLRLLGNQGEDATKLVSVFRSVSKLQAPLKWETFVMMCNNFME